MLPVTKTRLADPERRAMLLPALHRAQEQHGWLSPEAIKQVADLLDLTPGQVYSTASFYTMFKLQPQGQYRIQVCEGLSCYLVGGAEPIIDHICQQLNIKPGETTSDGKFTLEIVQCLATCDYAPAIMINGELFSHIDNDRIDEILSDLSAR